MSPGQEIKFDLWEDINPTQSENANLADIIDINEVRKRKNLANFDFNGFIPKVHQAALHHDIRQREWVSNSLWVCPRRWGKTIFCIIELLTMAIEKANTTKLPFLRYGHVFPDLTNAKKVAWEDWLHYTQGLPFLKSNSVSATVSFMVYSKYGKPVKVIIELIGLKNLQSKRGMKYDGLVLDERGSYPLDFRKVMLPMVSDETRQPTFIFGIGTPFEETDFWDEHDKFKGFEKKGNLAYHTFWTNFEKSRHIPPDKYEELKDQLSPEEFAIEIDCRRGVQTGASYFNYFYNQVVARGGVRNIAHNSAIKTSVICDIGGTTQKSKDLFSMWYVQYNPELGMYDMINYDELSGVSESSVFTAIQEKKYNIGQIILPWDADVGFRSTASMFRDLFPHAPVDVLTRTLKLTGIREARNFFNKVNFDEFNTAQGRKCLKRYSKEFDKQKRIYLSSPRHDQFSHGADAFIYTALAHKNGKLLAEGAGSVYNSQVQLGKSYNPLSGYDVNEMGIQ